MGVDTFNPQVSIVLKKVVGRRTVGGNVAASERFQAAEREIDLTPYLAQGGSVTVSKSVREPAGMFSITFADKMVPDQLESLYGLIEPMDVIEIRMARDVSLNDYAGLPQHMPIMMRGFVSQVQRNEGMSPAGPTRTVVVSGQDYGKILQIMRVTYLPGMVLGQDLLTEFKLFMNYGVGAQTYNDAVSFISAVMQNIVWEFQAKMRGQASSAGEDKASPILDIGVSAVAGTNGAVYPFGVNEWPGGTVYDLMRHFGDVGPWNELFIEDREAIGGDPAGPYLVYRPTPFKNISGELIQPFDGFADPIEVSDVELVGLDISRSDGQVANYYWVDAPQYALVAGPILQAGAAAGSAGYGANPYLADYPNSSPFLYGLRLMQDQSQQGMRVDGQAEAAVDAGSGIGVAMVNEKRRVLIENNKDNVVLEEGTMRLRGSERIKPGHYIRLTRGMGTDGAKFKADYYAHQVTHQYVYGGSYMTAVQFDRGTGFIERVKSGSGGFQPPYLTEMNLGGVYG